MDKNSLTKITTTANLLNHQDRIEHIKKLGNNIKTDIVEFFNINGKYNYYYQFIDNEWKTIIQLKLAGVDDWHRPVFKDVNSRYHYGDCDGTKTGKPTDVIAYYKENIYRLTYFGTQFNCEPNGGLNKNYKLVIID